MGTYNGSAHGVSARGQGIRAFSAFGAGAFILAVAAMTWAVTGWIMMEMAQRATL
jgi:hypothetical protein